MGDGEEDEDEDDEEGMGRFEDEDDEEDDEEEANEGPIGGFGDVEQLLSVLVFNGYLTKVKASKAKVCPDISARCRRRTLTSLPPPLCAATDHRAQKRIDV
jgi:hypothetical protein